MRAEVIVRSYAYESVMSLNNKPKPINLNSCDVPNRIKPYESELPFSKMICFASFQEGY